MSYGIILTPLQIEALAAEISLRWTARLIHKYLEGQDARSWARVRVLPHPHPSKCKKHRETLPHPPGNEAILFGLGWEGY